jgi:hypothetical protein
MKLHLLVSGLAILGLGGAAHSLLERPDALGFLHGALSLGGGLVICWIFLLKMPLHGIIGGGILALLGAARGLGNVPGLMKFLAGDRPRGVAPLLELGVTLICGLLLLRVSRLLSQERLRRMLAPEKD